MGQKRASARTSSKRDYASAPIHLLCESTLILRCRQGSGPTQRAGLKGAQILSTSRVDARLKVLTMTPPSIRTVPGVEAVSILRDTYADANEATSDEQMPFAAGRLRTPSQECDPGILVSLLKTGAWVAPSVSAVNEAPDELRSFIEATMALLEGQERTSLSTTPLIPGART